MMLNAMPVTIRRRALHENRVTQRRSLINAGRTRRPAFIVAIGLTITILLLPTFLFSRLLSGASPNGNDKLAASAGVVPNQMTWEEQFSVLRSFDPSSPPPQNGGKAIDILYYHVRKAGGSSIYEMFERINRKYANKPNPGSIGCYGQELPGHLDEFISWRNQDDDNKPRSFLLSPPTPSDMKRKLLVMSFREPIERTISHYFQAKPCPDGSGGGADGTCRTAAKGGVDMFLAICKFARSFQSSYLNNKLENLDEIDFVLPVDRVDEAIVIFAAKHNIPIQYLFYTHNKVPLNGADLNAAGNSNGGKKDKGKKKIFSCAAQWIERLIPAEKLRQCNATCGKACAGKVGMLAFTDRQLDKMKQMNADDTMLWREVIRRYEEKKQKILVQYGVRENELELAVAQYRRSRQIYEDYLNEVEGKVADDCALRLREKEASILGSIEQASDKSSS